jgi:hypothetical protein
MNKTISRRDAEIFIDALNGETLSVLANRHQITKTRVSVIVRKTERIITRQFHFHGLPDDATFNLEGLRKNKLWLNGLTCGS